MAKPKQQVRSNSPSKAQDKSKQLPSMKVGEQATGSTNVGEPTLGRSNEWVETVGLGTLRVLHNGTDKYDY